MPGVEIIAGAGGFAVGLLVGAALGVAAGRIVARRSVREIAHALAEYRMEIVGPEHEREARILLDWIAGRRVT